jgi:hypothetical protein
VSITVHWPGAKGNARSYKTTWCVKKRTNPLTFARETIFVGTKRECLRLAHETKGARAERERGAVTIITRP